MKGAIAEAAIALEAIRNGVEVFKPLSEHSRADLIFEVGSALYRVQCKAARRSGEVVCINLTGSRHGPTGVAWPPSVVGPVAVELQGLPARIGDRYPDTRRGHPIQIRRIDGDGHLVAGQDGIAVDVLRRLSALGRGRQIGIGTGADRFQIGRQARSHMRNALIYQLQR